MLKEKSVSESAITEAIRPLDTIQEIPRNSSLYYFATTLLMNKDKREMFMVLEADSKEWWLRMEEAANKK